jgi:hypothetical protein
MNFAERVFAERAVVADALDAKQASIGGEADFPERRKILEPSTDLEVARIVDDGLRPEGASLLVVLLDAGVLVVGVERGHDAFGEHASAKAAGRRARDAPVE